MPGLGFRSAEKIALHLLVEKPERATSLIKAIQNASDKLGPCKICGNLTEAKECSICLSEERETATICIVESVTDMFYRVNFRLFGGLDRSN